MREICTSGFRCRRPARHVGPARVRAAEAAKNSRNVARRGRRPAAISIATACTGAPAMNLVRRTVAAGSRLLIVSGRG